MTDQTPANLSKDDVAPARDWAAHVLSRPREYLPMENSAARALQALLPAPPRPTLADMTPEERAACRWMQADVEGLLTRRWMILNPYDEDGDVELVLESGRKEYLAPGRVTPRPDLPRMAWPSDKKPAPAPALPGGWGIADHMVYGRVFVTSASTSPNGDGYVYILLSTAESKGYDWVFCPTKRLTFLDTGQETDQ